MKSLPENAIEIDLDLIDIYALVDPREKRVKYIGASVSAKSRYHSHMRSNPRLIGWIRELKHQKLRPLLFILENVHYTIAPEREDFWISYFGSNNLLNSTSGHSGRFSILHRNRRKPLFLNPNLEAIIALE